MAKSKLVRFNAPHQSSSGVPLGSSLVEELVYSSEDDEEEEVGKKNKEQEEDDSSSDDSDEDGEVAIQVNRFFAELDIDEGKQKKRLLEEGVHAPKRKGVLPPRLHSVMGNANLRLARGDTAGAIELSMEVIRQGRGWLTKIMCYLKLAHV